MSWGLYIEWAGWPKDTPDEDVPVLVWQRAFLMHRIHCWQHELGEEELPLARGYRNYGDRYRLWKRAYRLFKEAGSPRGPHENRNPWDETTTIPALED